MLFYFSKKTLFELDKQVLMYPNQSFCFLRKSLYNAQQTDENHQIQKWLKEQSQERTAPVFNIFHLFSTDSSSVKTGSSHLIYYSICLTE